jgi:hypothetical protein
MQDLEPFYNWRHLYIASEDELSPFFEREYSEFEYTNHIYDFALHPQWDDIGSETLFIKVLMADYEDGYAVIELIGEWNDCINNDIMFLKREIIDTMLQEGINKFILIGENVLNFHASDDSYYEEWNDELEDGWIAFLNFREHVLIEFATNNLDYYILLGGKLNNVGWRTYNPAQLFLAIEMMVTKRIGN